MLWLFDESAESAGNWPAAELYTDGRPNVEFTGPEMPAEVGLAASALEKTGAVADKRCAGVDGKKGLETDIVEVVVAEAESVLGFTTEVIPRVVALVAAADPSKRFILDADALRGVNRSIVFFKTEFN